MKVYFKGENREEFRTEIVDFVTGRNALLTKEEWQFHQSDGHIFISFNNENELNQLLDEITLDFDLMITYGAPIIRNKNIIQSEKCLNVHMGLSRFYRGGSTNILALAKGEYEKVGTTIHYLSESIDGGDIVQEFAFKDFDLVSSYNDIQYLLLKNVLNWFQSFLANNLPFESLERMTVNSELLKNNDLDSEKVIQCERNVKSKSTKKL
jgi:methionyl-tRNA formyltransferase